MNMNEELLQQSAVVTDNIMVGLLDSLNVASQQNLVMESVQLQETDEIYHEVGIDMHVELNSVVKKGDKLVTVYYNKKGVDEILHTIQKAIKIKSKVQDVKYSPIYKILT